jgi:hypothetical protein
MSFGKIQNYMKKARNLFLLAGLIIVCSCTSLPSDFIDINDNPPLFPDIIGVTIPVNIAPLNFKLTQPSEKIIAVFSGRRGTLRVYGNEKIIIPINKWHNLLESNSGDSLSITLYAKLKGKWTRYKPFRIEIKSTPADPYLVYRMIAPGYESWSKMGIYQRNITNFTEEPIIDNRFLPGNCMNCHCFNQNDPDQMVFHLRGKIGATIIVKDGKVVKLSTKTSETISNCVYPFWHPSGNYIAFSVNLIYQVFHSVNTKRIEVLDSKSDIVILSLKENKLITSEIISSEESLETFPAFSDDGKTLLFCSAKKRILPADYEKIKYSLCKISFDATSGTFGKSVDTLVSSYLTGKSVSFPRASFDGKFIMFTMSDYGNFSIWHKESDLYLLNLADCSVKPLRSANSDNTESYHSWSSDSHWFVFSSRRIDGLYTRPYIAWLNENGESSKPFLLPQKDPDFYDRCLLSFNIPEFVTKKVKVNGRNMLRKIESVAKDVEFELKE